MTKKELSQLYWLNREVVQQQDNLAKLQSQAERITSTITGMPKGGGHTKQEVYAEIADTKGIIEANIQKIFYERSRIERYINSIDDSQMRLILRLRYINGLTWQQVAFEIGEYDESFPRLKHNRFLGKIKVTENTETEMI